jgi:outer membrane protein OmpA-like peptidoglycan-associated protein/tetratricopeptide (TPR) repeat protein
LCNTYSMRRFLTGILIVLSLATQAQEEYSISNRRVTTKFEMAKRYYVLRDFENATRELKEAVETEPEFIEAWLLLGQVQTDAGKLDESIDAYNHALEINPLFFPNAIFFLAENEMAVGKYYDARVHYEWFLALGNTSPEIRDAALKSRASCSLAIHSWENPVPFEPVNLGPSINTQYDEYWPSLSADESMLVYTMLLPIDPKNPAFQGNRQEDLYYSRYENGHWMPAQDVGSPPNTSDNEGAQSISGNGMFMVFTGCMRDDGYGLCDLYFSENRNGTWTVPKNIGPPISTRYSEKQPALSSDGRILYFSSNRPGGYGQYDLWMSVRGDDGAWSRPVNMGKSINTEGYDQSPFMHPDNKTLYFSSTGWPGMGGYDIFLSRKTSDSTWSEPMNLGYPINTFHDEQGLIVNSRANMAYFSSNRLSEKGLDIFSFELYFDARPNRVSYMKGKVYDSETLLPLEAKFELIDLASSKTVISSSSDPGNGEFLVVIPVGADYALNVSRPSYLFHSENFSFDKVYGSTEPFYMDIALKPIMVGESITLRNVFYKTDSFALDSRSKVELGKVVSLLEANGTLAIEIGGHTDNVGTAAYNINLSGRRAEEVVKYLVSKGIARERIQSRGYGMNVPVATNDTDEGRAQNRRTELKILAK